MSMMYFTPQEDITASELAQILPILCGRSFVNYSPPDGEKPPPFLRHFEKHVWTPEELEGRRVRAEADRDDLLVRGGLSLHTI